MKNFRLLRADEIDCRAAQVKSSGVSLLLYKDARCDMNILDETVGMMNWQKQYSRENRNCTVFIWDADKKEWVGKEDTGTESNTEQEKGLASDSFKRACFNWGIGRELYSAPFIWIPADKCNITASANGGYKCFDRWEVTDIGYDDNERICKLEIINEKTKEVVYSFGGKRSTDGLPTAHQRTLKNVLKKHGYTETEVCDHFGVNALKDLSIEQFRKLMDSMGEAG